MRKAKFKVGDKVRILDGRNIDHYVGTFITQMAEYIGRIVTISNIKMYPDGRVGYRMKEIFYSWDERGLELVNPERIEIYRQNNLVVALDHLTGKEAVARCNPEDKFDFYFGANLAFSRLVEDKLKKEYPEPVKKPLNAKIVFTKGDGVFKTGHLYEIKDGTLKIPDSENDEYLPGFPAFGMTKFYSIDEVETYFKGTCDRNYRPGWSSNTLEFIGVKED